MILKPQTANFKEFSTDSFVTANQLLSLLEKRSEFKSKLTELFNINDESTQILKIGNIKHFLNIIESLDNQCEKIDIISRVKDTQLLKLLEEEKALFETISIKNDFILSHNKSDILIAETRYSAKADILDYYNLSKFANYCRDKEYGDLVDIIKTYLEQKNIDNEDIWGLRFVYSYEEKIFFIRAVTSSDGYKDFGINFSLFAVFAALGNYADTDNGEVFIDNYSVDDSRLYISFSMGKPVEINKSLTMSFSLVLENDEVKDKSVSFNGVFKLKFDDGKHNSEIYLKPKGFKKPDSIHPTDLLSFEHRGKVDSVFEKLQTLPTLIDYFIKQVGKDAEKISSITHPNDVKEFIAQKVDNSRKPEFKGFKKPIFDKLMGINVDSTYKLFEALRQVEELFEHQDIISRDFWRTKLYESLIDGN